MKEQEAQKTQRTFPGYFYNNITSAGVVLAIAVLLAEVLLFGLDFSGALGRSLRLLAYLILPPFLFLGLILIPLGARWKKYQAYKNIEPSKVDLIVIDPSLPRHRHAINIFLLGTIIYFVMTMVGSYKAYQYIKTLAIGPDAVCK